MEDPSTAEPRQVGRERLDEQPFTLSYARSVQQGISDVWLRSGEGERRWRQLREEMIAGLQRSESGNFVVRERLARSLVRRMMAERADQLMTDRATQGLAQEAMPEVPELVICTEPSPAARAQPDSAPLSASTQAVSSAPRPATPPLTDQ